MVRARPSFFLLCSRAKIDRFLIVEQSCTFARAQPESVIEASPHRGRGPVPDFGACGGCHYQHTSYEHQLEIKKEILRESLRRAAKLDLPFDIEVHPSPPWNYRNRSRSASANCARPSPQDISRCHRMTCSRWKSVRSVLRSSTAASQSLWLSGRAGKVPEGVREVEFFANADDTQLLIEVGRAREARRRRHSSSGPRNCSASMPEIAGVVAFREANPAATGQKVRSVRRKGSRHLEQTHLTYKTQRAVYRVSAGSFFQTNRHLTDELVQIVTAGQSGELALDLYAGVGLFSTALAGDFHHIFSVESSQTSLADLAYNQSSNGEAVQATTEQYLAR